MIALEILNQLLDKILITIAMITILATMRHIAFANSARFILAKYLASYISAFAMVAGVVLGYSTSPYQVELDFSNPQGMINISYGPTLALPSNAIPSNQVQFAIPSNAIPSNAIPSNAIPSNAIPSNFTIVDAGTLEKALPASAIPSNALPASALPASVIPSTIGGVEFKHQTLPDFGEKVCKDRCDESTKYMTYSNRAGVELARPSDSNDAGEELASSSQDFSSTISVQFYADAYALTKGECTNLHWDATGSKDVWINEIPSDIGGAKQVCPATSTTYLIVAEGADGTQISSSLIIQVQEAVAESNSGVEVAKPDRCDLFDDMDMKVTYLDWTSGAPLKFHFKMPGGVPGLGKEITGDSGIWKYSAQIGSYTSSNCEVIQGYEDRLYCTVPLPSTYSSTLRPMTLNVNECESPIYSIQTASLPAAIDSSEDSAAGGGSGDDSDGGGSGGDVCGPEPDDSGSPEWSDWCGCRWDNNLSC